MRRLLALLVYLAILGPTDLVAQPSGRVAGVVLDAVSSEPVPGATVRVPGTVLVATTDESGRFVLFGVPTGPQRLALERFGYAPMEIDMQVTAGTELEIEVRLDPRAVAVGGIVTTVTKGELSALQAPMSISVLDEEEIRQRVPETAADAVAYTPALQFVGDQLNIRGSSGYSRGAGSRVLLLVDGVPANAGDSGAINWDVIPLTELVRIEVLKGAGSALYGTSALGGVVNVVTAMPPATPTTRLRLRGGFYDDPPASEWIWSDETRGYGTIEASHGRRLGPIGVWLRAGRTADDGYRENGDLERTNLAFQMRAGGETDTLGLFGSWARERYGASLLWCGIGQCADPLRLAFQAARVPAEARDDRTRSDKSRLHLTHSRRWSALTRSFVRLHFQRNDWETDFGTSEIGARANRLGGELRIERRATSWLLLTGGGEVAHTDVSADNFFGSTAGTAERANHKLTDLALYLQGQWGVADWVDLTVGARFDLGLLDGGSLTDPYTSQLSPRVGAVLALDRVTRVRASLGRGFRSPSADELFSATEVGGFLVVPNAELRPERSLAGELGVQRLVAPWMSLDLAGFFYDFEDFIEADTTFSPEGILIQFDNLPAATVAGIEAIGRLSLFADRLQGMLAYTYLHHEDQETGEPLAYRPNHLLTASGNFGLGTLQLGADYRFASAFDRVKVFTNPRNDPLVPMRLVDLRLAYRLGRQTLRFIVNNAANYGYTTIERNLEPIRRYTLSLDLKF